MERNCSPRLLVIGSSNGSSNLGDTAMWEAAVDTIRSVSPSAQIITDGHELWQPTRDSVQTLPFLYKHLLRGPVGKVDPVRAGFRRLQNRRPGPAAYRKAQLFIEGKLRGDTVEKWYDAIEHTDLIVVSGAGGITDEFAVHGIYSWYAIAQYGKRRGKDVAFVGQGVGPISNRVARRAAGQMLSAASLVTTRDSESAEVVTDLGYALTVAATPDWALVRANNESEIAEANALREELLSGSEYAAVSIHAWRAARRTDLKTMRSHFRQIVSAFVGDGLKVLGVSNATGIRAGDDRIFMGALRDSLPASLRPHVHILNERVSPGVARSLYGDAKALVATRYHPIVFALSEGTPVLGLAYDRYYEQKISGALRWYGEESRSLCVSSAPDALASALREVHQDDDRETRQGRTAVLETWVTEPLTNWLVDRDAGSTRHVDP